MPPTTLGQATSVLPTLRDAYALHERFYVHHRSSSKQTRHGRRSRAERVSLTRRSTFSHPDPREASERPAVSWRREARRRARVLSPSAHPAASGSSGTRRPWVSALGAMLAAAAIATTYGLPAYAVPDDVVGGAVTVQNFATGEIQTLQVDGATVTVTAEQGFTSVAPPPPPPPVVPAQTPGVSAVAELGLVPAGTQVQWPTPTSQRISSPFGPRVSPCGGCSSNHQGLDLDPGNGAPIQAIARGVVRQVVSSTTGLGMHVIIDHEVNGQLLSSTYAHMQYGSVLLRAGQVIEAGDRIGRVGTTGASTGPHLHLELAYGTKRIDPYQWLTTNMPS
jgi:murein DD-endopeptidase MepM/ murein hydrolase activator NlpD